MIEFEVIDLFAGGGGVTSGFDNAEINGRKICKIIAAVNHDANAIAAHAANHPETQHFIEDITTLDVTKLPTFSKDQNIRSILWASLECTNFSKAKGGQSRDADSRTLAEHLYRYIDYLNPDYIEIENVREFMTWGPLVHKKNKFTFQPLYNKDGSPVMIPDPKHKGCDYQGWVDNIKARGYNFEYKILNSADYGAHTSRSRYFGMFAKHGLPIIFPKPTHSKTGDHLPRWKAVREKLDLSNYGKSIYERKKPLVERTMRRIAYGIDKFVLNGQGDQFLISYYGASKKAHSIENPLGTICTKDRYALVNTEPNNHFLMEFYGRDNAVTPIEHPAKTISTQNRTALITVENQEPEVVQFLSQNIWGNEKCNTSIEKPSPTLLTEDEKVLATVEFNNDKFQFINNYYSGGGQLSDINDPCPTITSVPKSRLVTVDIEKKDQFIEHRYSGIDNVASLEKPLGTITNNPKSSLVTVLKDAGVIKDIKIRMLTVQEMKEITGFAPDYILTGNQTSQKKLIGNAVTPVIPEQWVKSMYYEFEKLSQEMAA